MGDSLLFAQFGEKPLKAKPFKGIAPGVFEISYLYSTDAFRVLYAVKIGDKIFVLHAFQKKAKKGTSTPKKEINIIKQRYKIALNMEVNK
jgi:phage-related protein